MALTRFLTGVGLGAEWGVGTSLLQEMWPEQFLTKAAAFPMRRFPAALSSRRCCGSCLAALRRLLALDVCRRHHPSHVRCAAWPRHSGVGSLDQGQPPPASIGDTARQSRNLVLAVVVSISITLGFWAISSWVPTYVATLASDPKSGVYYAGMAGLFYAIGEIIGCIAFGFLSDSWGRRWTLAFYLAGSIAITPVVFLWVRDPTTVVALQIANGFSLAVSTVGSRYTRRNCSRPPHVRLRSV